MKEDRISQLIKSKQLLKVSSDKERALSLIESAKNTGEVALEMELNEKGATTIFREIYESIRQLGDALWWIEGYNPQNHEVSIEMLKDTYLNLDFISSEQKVKLNSLERFKSIRHSANYRGFKISVSQAREITNFWNSVGKDILKNLKNRLKEKMDKDKEK